MSNFYRVQGDVNDTLVVALNGIANLDAAASVEAHVRLHYPNESATLPAAVTDSADRQITVQLEDASGWLSTAIPGTWTIEYQVTFLDGSILTWPAPDLDTIVVRAQSG